MSTHHAHTASDDSQPALVEVGRPAGVAIGKRLWLVDGDGQRAVFLGGTAIHVYDVTDRDAERVCIASLSTAGLAFDVEIAEAFGVHRNTVGRLARQLKRQGIAGVVAAKRGPKGPHKVTGEVQAVIDRGLAAGLGPAAVTRQVVEQTGVSLSREHVRQLMAARRTPPAHQPTLDDDQPEQAALDTDDGHNHDGDEDGDEHACSDGVAAADEDDQVDVDDQTDVDDSDDHDDEDDSDEDDSAAGCDEGGVDAGGVGFDPPVVLPERVVGDYMGLSLLYPAVAALGLVEVAREHYRLPRSERFGVRAVTLTLLFLTLLGLPTVEAAKHLRRAAFGAVVGCGRAPAVKTLRRKLAEMAAQGRAGSFGAALSRRWVQSGVIDTAYLYVDGHMQAYTGKRRVQKVWSTKRRMPLPGIHTYHVGDITGRPLLFVTEQVSTNLAKAMPRIVAAIREAIGEERTFTIIFDRGGYDSKLFAWLDSQGIGFITYQRGEPDLPKTAFTRRETRFEGRRIRMYLAEDEVSISGAGPWRRVVVRTPNGHQTPILTNLPSGKVGPARLACLMFARWRQENLFKYMGEHHGLDQLVSYAADPADPNMRIANPKRGRLDRDIKAQRRKLAKLKAELGEVLLDEPRDGSRTAHGLKTTQKGAVKQLRDLEDDIDRLIAQRKQTPTHITVAELDEPRHIMRLEHKHIVDRIRICAYNAEQWLLDRLVDHYPNRHDVRDLLRALTRLPGHMDTTDAGIHVTLEAPDTPAHRRALAGLIDELNTHHVVYPGTDLPVTYHLAVHPSEAAA